MHDHYVDECLWTYKKQDQFYALRREDMYDYEKFLTIVSAFREHYKLTCSFKKLDKFLWRIGDRIFVSHLRLCSGERHSSVRIAAENPLPLRNIYTSTYAANRRYDCTAEDPGPAPLL